MVVDRRLPSIRRVKEGVAVRHVACVLIIDPRPLPPVPGLLRVCIRVSVVRELDQKIPIFQWVPAEDFVCTSDSIMR